MQLNLLVIKTKEIDKLAEFYSVLGLEFQYHRHGDGLPHYSAQIGEVVFEIYPLGKNQNEPD